MEALPPTADLVSQDALSVLSVLPQTWYIFDVLGQVRAASATPTEFGVVVLGQLEDRRLLEIVGEVVDSGQQYEGEVCVPRSRTFPERTFRVRMAPLAGHQALALIEDVTEERRLDSMRRDFVANVSHELKTPVGALSLLAEAIEAATDDPDTVLNFARRIRREAERLSGLVVDLIDLSSVQTASPGDMVDDIALDELVTGVCDDVQTIASARQIEIVVGGTGNLHLAGRREQLASALRNLLLNAIYYSPEGGRVALGTKLDGDYIEIAVVDQGIGISPADQDRVFERFYRVDPARSRDTGGTGLGLAIVKHVCASHGGECTVWSQPGHGSTFTMRLPQRYVNEAREAIR